MSATDPTRAAYLDASALAKLVMVEPETAAMRSWLVGHRGELVTGDLTRTELARAVGRRDASLLPLARSVLEGLVVLTMPSSLYDDAGRVGAPDLPTLDALHLACAASLGDRLGVIVTYDERMAHAAHRLGIPTVAPD